MKHRLLLIILSPFILIILLISIAVGIISLNLETAVVAQQLSLTLETARIAVLLFSCLAIPFQLLFIAFIFTLAFMIHRRRWRIAAALLNSRLIKGWIVRPSTAVVSLGMRDDDPHKPVTAYEHRHTVQQLIASLISLTAFSAAAILSLAQFVRLSSLAVLVTVITGGLAWGARTLISDLLSGISNIFEDNFDVGDKVQFAFAGEEIEGIIEKVTVRLAHLRAPSGELTIVPHGELRVLRNFSRGEFSGTTVTLLIKSTDLQRTIMILQDLGQEAPELLPDMLEPWRVLNLGGELGIETEITLISKAVHGRGAALRLQMMGLASARLEQAHISLVDKKA